MARSPVLLVACLFAVACGGSSPSAPSAPQTSSVSVVLAGSLISGRTAQATATATLSNGQTLAVTTGFRSDNPAVATVTDAGMVNAVANGVTNISVAHGSQQGARPIRVYPSYQGQWRGSYVIRNCTSSGVFAAPPNFCDGKVNTVLPVSLTLTQADDTITGSFLLGALPFSTFSAPIEGDGAVGFNATMTQTGAVSIMASWRLNSAMDGRITGRGSQLWRAPGLTGEGTLDSDVVDWLNRIGTAASAREHGSRPAPGDRTGLFQMMRGQ